MSKCTSLEDFQLTINALERYAEEYRHNLYLPHFLRARETVISCLLNNLNYKCEILDINCGTALDAILLARHGHQITGIDISSTMISIAKEEIARAGVSALVKVEVADYRSMPHFERKFDAVLSNFGGLNFASNLDHIFTSVASTLNQGGIFHINTLNRCCIGEIIIFLLHGKLTKALRRIIAKKGRIGGRQVKLYYHSRSLLINEGLKCGFKLIDSFGLNIFAPPLWANDFYRYHDKFAIFLEKIDDKARRFPVIRSLGDFMVLTFQKVT